MRSRFDERGGWLSCFGLDATVLVRAGPQRDHALVSRQQNLVGAGALGRVSRRAAGRHDVMVATAASETLNRMLEIAPTAIADVKVFVPKAIRDERGSFCETYHAARLAERGIELNFVQDNQSWSARAGTIRGLHFQSPPRAQDKLVRVIRGRIFDVAVDLRRSSPTYGRWVAEELSAHNRKQVLVPIGFAHGFCTLEPDTEVFYKVTDYYSPANDLGLAWDDTDLAIGWPVTRDNVTLSEKDARWPTFGKLATYFR
jgi:dTDP-4-dehydrorhamnose 3,5-epimerase